MTAQPMRRVVIVGGSLAGVAAADGLRGAGYQGEIVLVDGEHHLPYDRPPLSKEALHSGIDVSRLSLRPPDWYAERGITMSRGRWATGLDIGARTLTLTDTGPLSYDGLIIASGSRARKLGIGAGRRPLAQLRTIDDAARLRQQLAPGRHLVVIGAGFIGLEVAASARQLGLEVTVIEVAETPLSRALGDPVGAWFADLHTRHGVRLLCSSSVERISDTGSGVRLQLLGGEPIDADVVVAGVGAAPATDWLAGSGIRLSNGVLCRQDLSVAAPQVVAAGDVARWYNPVFDEEMRVEHWTNANEQGRHAALTLLGERQAYAAVPYFWTDQHSARMRFVGRASAADEVAILAADPDRLVALYGRDGVLSGAVCVNAPRELARYRTAIRDRIAWRDVIASTEGAGPPQSRNQSTNHVSL